MLQKNVSKEREKTHKNLCTYYTLSRARATAHRDLPRPPWKDSSSSSHSRSQSGARIRKYYTDHHQIRHERDDDDDDAPEKSRRFTNDDAFVSGTTTTTVRVPTKVVAKRRHAFRRDDVLHRL